jgi:hypothetical protein
MNIAKRIFPGKSTEDRGVDRPTIDRNPLAGSVSGYHLWHRIARECDAMAEDLSCRGRALPPDLVEWLAEALTIFDQAQSPAADESGSKSGDADDRPKRVSPANAALLAKTHAALAAIIAPASPEAVLLLIEERRRQSAWYVFGPLPIVRQMLGLALFSLCAMLGVSLSEYIDRKTLSTMFLDMSGVPLLMVEIFLISAASLGSCFQNLQQISAYISAGTYDPRFQSTYWTRWVMGVISGFVLAELIHDLLLATGPAANAAGPDKIGVSEIGVPLLALLGGYSVDLVHGILSHIVDTLASFFRISLPDPGGDRPTETPPAVGRLIAVPGAGD